MTYYIYHIEGVKIGCTMNPTIRPKKQGYPNYSILEEHDDIYIASDREIELQKQYKYPVDTQPYWKTIKIASKEGRLRGGSKARDSGQLSLTRDKGGEVSKLRYSIPIIAYDKITKKLVGEYYSVKEAARQLGLRSCTIHVVLKGRQKSANGYIFNYKA